MSFFNRFRLESYQALYWIIYFFILMEKNILRTEPYPWWLVCLSGLLVMSVVYTIVFIFARAYLRPLRVALLLTVAFLLYSLFYYSLIYGVLPGWGVVAYNKSDVFTWEGFFFSMFLFFQHALVEGGLLAAVYRIRAKEREKRALLEKSHQMEVQFLTAQIDPHEKTNLLNIPYQLAVAANDNRMAAVLRQIKQLFLYVSEKAGGIRGEVPLGEEIAQCERIVWLNKRRFGKGFVHIDVPEAFYRWSVPVSSVSALLQNAFKYGMSSNEQLPITLEAWQTANQRIIRVRNKINPHKTDEPSTGIGNENIRQRLALLYGGSASLETTEGPDRWYESTLLFNES